MAVEGTAGWAVGSLRPDNNRADHQILAPPPKGVVLPTYAFAGSGRIMSARALPAKRCSTSYNKERALLFLWRLPLAQSDFGARGQFFIFLDNVQHHAFGIRILHLLCQDAHFFRAIAPVLRVVDVGHPPLPRVTRPPAPALYRSIHITDFKQTGKRIANPAFR